LSRSWVMAGWAGGVGQDGIGRLLRAARLVGLAEVPPARAVIWCTITSGPAAPTAAITAELG
jgi:hypothetical protein